MTPEEIKAQAPEGATSYMIDCGKVHYLKLVNGEWRVYFNYDDRNGWVLANQTAIDNNIDRLQPL